MSFKDDIERIKREMEDLQRRLAEVMVAETLDNETLTFIEGMQETTLGLLIIGDRVAEMESETNWQPSPEIPKFDELDKKIEKLQTSNKKLNEEVRQKLEEGR